MTSPSGPMSPSTASSPRLGVAHPLRIGKSVRGGRRPPARDLLSLKFTHVPTEAGTQQPGRLRRTGEKVTVELDTSDASSSLSFSGARRPANTGSAVSDYVLVFIDGAVWLERAGDVFTAIRPVDAARRRPPLNSTLMHMSDDPVDDPDSWYAPEDEASGSPITPEDDTVMDETPPVPTRPAPSARRLVSPTTSSAPPRPAAKTVGGKTVTPRRLSEHADGDDDGTASPASSSSGEDESDSSSDSDSDSDSDNYTDRSSDED